jgi:hypothetical protein
MQEHTEDLFIFSDSKDNLSKLADSVADFMNDAHINFNPEKRRLIIHNYIKKTPLDFSPDRNGNLKKVNICEIADIIKYLVFSWRRRKLA